MEKTKVSPEKLTNFSSRVLQEFGVPEEQAKITADILTTTDLRGIDSHGVAHLQGFYVKGIKEGTINPQPEFTLTEKSPTTAVIDGDQGLGFVAGYRAMTEAITKAEEFGSGFVAVRNSSHFGAASYYAMMALKHDMIGFATTVGGRMMVAPGSKGRAGGLNPIAVAMPTATKPPFVLDMSTSVVAGGQVEIARRQGKSIPPGWVVNEKGEPITDPEKVFTDLDPGAGFLPLGGTPEQGAYKGFGLAVMVDILCTVLAGAETGTSSNHFFGALSVEGFQEINKFKKQTDEIIAEIESLPTQPDVEKIYAPGGPEAEIEQERLSQGIPLPEKIVAELKELSRETGVPWITS